MQGDHGVRARDPRAHVTASTEDDAVVEAVAADATEYLQKETDREQLLSAVRDVARGDLRLPTEIVRRTFEAIRGSGRTEDAAAGLTSREREILVSFGPGHVLRSDSGGEGHQAGDRSERHLRRPAKVESQDDAGVSALVCA